MAVEKSFTVIDHSGIHARPASKLVQKASQFDSEITIEYGERSSNLKSIMGVLAMGIKKGSTIKIIADGYDEVVVIEKIEEVLKLERLVE